MTPTNGHGVVVASCDLGRGLFATRDFREGEVIVRFTGPLITLEEAVKNGEANANALQIGPTDYIDPEPPGVFLNHSCEPNAGMLGKTMVRALRPIRAGEEIFFDYSTTMSEKLWTMRCECGASVCRGIIGDFHDLPEELQQRYLALEIVQPFIVEEWRARQSK